MNYAGILMDHTCEYIVLDKARRALRNQLRSRLRILHNDAAARGATVPLSPSLAMLPRAAVNHESGGDLEYGGTLDLPVPAWLMKPPIGMAKKDWHPHAFLTGGQAADVLYVYCQQLDAEAKARRKQVEAAARQLPVWPWVDSIPGIGPFGFGLLIGATGDLSFYANPAKVWKRMGLGLVQGQRQRRVTDKELAELMGYNPARRALAFNLGKGLIKKNFEPDKSPGVYRQLYLDRKVYEQAKAEGLSKQAWDRRAARYMVKRFLRDLWREWQRVTPEAHLVT